MTHRIESGRTWQPPELLLLATAATIQAGAGPGGDGNALDELVSAFGS